MADTMTINTKNGANRCPNCGATDVSLDSKSGKLRCKFCRTLFKGKKANERGGVENLKGEIIGSGAGDIIPDAKIIVTIKCPSCGAEVVINTDEAVSARCHWCRHILSLNEKMPNGAVPDLVLPFKAEKAEAEEKIREFVSKRRFFAHPKFRKEFTTENIMGVYLPYMVVDINAHAEMSGEAEHLIRSYTTGSGNNKRRYYDAEAFAVTRDFDLLVDDLTVEASSKRLDQDIHENTNNIINAIMPFDTENCEDWNPGYLRGYASERRDTNVKDLHNQLDLQIGDIARYKVKETMDYYNRGAKWTSEKVETKGILWKSAYLPVWLYSYLEVKGDKKMLHYVAVNARTLETMGSVPINKRRLLIVSTLLEIIGIILGFIWFRFWFFSYVDFDDDDNNFGLIGLALFTPGFLFYWIKTARYRNMNARHKHEAETVSEIRNVKKTDKSLGRRNRLSSSRIVGENDSEVKGVVAKAAKSMMGEKMANYLGIGRMEGSKIVSTRAGQKAVADYNAKASGLKVALRVFVITMALTIFLLVGSIIFFGAREKVKTDRKGATVKAPTVVVKKVVDEELYTKIKEYAKETHKFVTSHVGRVYMKDSTSEVGITEYKSESGTSFDGIYYKSFDYKKDETGDGFIGDSARGFDEVLTLNGMVQDSFGDYYDEVKDKNVTIGTYRGKSSDKDSMIYCSIIEYVRLKNSLGTALDVELDCATIDTSKK